MSPPFDQTTGLVLLPAQPPKGKEQEDSAKGVADFRLSPEKLKETKESIGITDFTRGEIRIILERAYDGLKIRDAAEEGRKINIIYEENNGLIREPATVLKEGKADCDEATRTAYLLAWESGVRNITMVEMKWTDPKMNERTGHSFIVLMSQSKEEAPRIYDLTYYKKGKPLQVGSDGLEAAIRREYTADAVNQNFAITMRMNLNEVEAAHYDQVGEFYDRRNWKNVREAYERAVKLVPTEFRYNLNLAVSYEKRGGYDDAVKYYEKCSKMREGMADPKVFAFLGAAYANCGRETDAIKAFEDALKMNPSKELEYQVKRYLKELSK